MEYMLHVILFILKILGIVLVSMLGLLILLICCGLFVPVRYSVQAQKSEDISIQAKAGWMFRCIYFNIRYENGKPIWKFRILGYPLLDSERPVKKKVKSQHKKKQRRKKQDTSENTTVTTRSPILESEENTKTQVNLNEPVRAEKFDDTKTKEVIKNSIVGKIRNKLKNLYEKLVNIPQTVKNIIAKIREKIYDVIENTSLLLKRLSSVWEFIQDEVNKTALKKIWESIRRFIRHIKPYKVKAEVRFGTEDPCTTGEILAIISLIYHLYQDNVKIIPDFENSILEGNVFIKGKIRAFSILVIAVQLMCDRNFKQLKRNYNKLKEEL